MTFYVTTMDFNQKKQSMLTKEKQSKKTNLLQVDHTLLIHGSILKCSGFSTHHRPSVSIMAKWLNQQFPNYLSSRNMQHLITVLEQMGLIL